MDPDVILNIVLVACACVFLIAVAYRMLRGEPGPQIEEKEDRESAEVPPEPRAALGAIPEPISRPPPKSGQPAQLFAKAATESPDEVQRSARKMVDYALLRGGATSIRPEVLERMALQFGLLEVVLREASRDAEGRLRVIPDEQMSDVLRESFRLAASQARK